MAQRATTGFAKKPTAGSVDRTVRVVAAGSDPVPLKLAPMVAPYKKHGRLSLRLERMPQQSRLSAGRNNGNNSWSLGLDEIEGLAFIPAEGFEQPHTLALRIIGLDDNGETIAVLDVPVVPVAKAKAADAGGEDIAGLKAMLATREAELAALRGGPVALASKGEATVSRHEVDRRTTAEVAEAVERARKSWEVETNERLAAVEEREQNRRLEARDLWKREAQQALIDAEGAWKLGEEARLAAAEKKWREDLGRTQPQAVGGGGDADRLRTELASVRALLQSRDGELARAREDVEQTRTRAEREARDARDLQVKARAAWESEAQTRRSSDELQWKSKIDRAIIETRAQVLAESGGKDRESEQLQARIRSLEATLDARIASQSVKESEIQRLEGEVRELQAALSDRDVSQTTRDGDLERLQNSLRTFEATLAARDDELRLVRIKADQTEERMREEHALALRTAEETWKSGESARLAAAELRWRENSSKAVNDAAANSARAEAALAQARSEWDASNAEQLKRTEGETTALKASLAAASARSESAESDLATVRLELQKLRADPRAELSALKESLAERDSQLARVKQDHAEELEDVRQEAHAALIRAEAQWRDAQPGLGVAQGEDLSQALAEATQRYEAAEARVAELLAQPAAAPAGDNERVRKLRAEVAQLRTALGERDNELAYALASLESRNNKVQQAEAQKYKSFEEREAERAKKANNGRLIIEIAAAGAIAFGAFFLYPRVVSYLPDSWQENIATVTDSVGEALGQSPAPVAAAPVAPAPVKTVQTTTVTRAANMRTEPSSQGTILMTLKRGSAVSILEQQGNWTRVDIGDKSATASQGWVFSSYLASLDTQADPKPK